MTYSDETLRRVEQAIRDAYVDTHDPFGRPWAELEDWERALLLQHAGETLDAIPLQPKYGERIDPDHSTASQKVVDVLASKRPAIDGD